MKEFTTAAFSFLVDNCISMIKKIIVILFIILVLFIVDYVFSYTYFYRVNKQVDSIEKISRLKNSNEISSNAREFLIKKENEIINLKTNSFTSKTSKRPNTTFHTLLHIISSSGLLFVMLFFVVLFKKDFVNTPSHTREKMGAPMVITMIIFVPIFCFIMIVLLSLVTSLIPYLGNPYLNYLLNFVIQILLVPLLLFIASCIK